MTDRNLSDEKKIIVSERADNIQLALEWIGPLSRKVSGCREHREQETPHVKYVDPSHIATRLSPSFLKSHLIN